MSERITAQVSNVATRKRGASLTANVALGASTINVNLVDGVFNADSGQLIIGADVYAYTVPEYLATIAPQNDTSAPAPVAGEEDPPEPETTFSGVLNISPNAVRAYTAEDKVYVWPIIEEHIAIVVEPGNGEDIEAVIDHSLYARLVDGPRAEGARETVTCEYRPQGLTVIDVLGSTPVEDLNNLLITTDPSQSGERVEISADGIREYEADGVTVAVSLLEKLGLDLLADSGVGANVTRMIRWLKGATTAARLTATSDASNNTTLELHSYTAANQTGELHMGVMDATGTATNVGLSAQWFDYAVPKYGRIMLSFSGVSSKILWDTLGVSEIFETVPSGGWQNWTPTLTGWSANPTGGIYRYKQVGKTVHMVIRQPNTGTSNNAAKTFTLPVTAATIANMVWSGAAAITDNGTAQTTPGRGVVNSAGTTVSFFKDWVLGGFTASGAAAIRECYLTYEAA